MQMIHSSETLDHHTRLRDFIDSETEKIFMVIGAEEISLAAFRDRHAQWVKKNHGLLVLWYDIWPREHSRHFLYRWLDETAAGRACQEPDRWAERVDANPHLQTQLDLLKTRDPRPLEVRFLEAIRFVAEKLGDEQSLLLNIAPLTASEDTALVDFFKSILRLLPAKTKMIINQCENDMLARQSDFCPSNRIKADAADAADMEALLKRYARSYPDEGNSGRLLRALAHLGHPVSISEVARFMDLSEGQIREISASDECETMVLDHGDHGLRLAYPRLLSSRQEMLPRPLAEALADLNRKALAYYQERLSTRPDASAVLGHSMALCRLDDSQDLTAHALSSYRPKLEWGAGEISQMELQLALDRVGQAEDETRGRLLLALAEVMEAAGRNHDALNTLEKAIEVLRKTERLLDLQTAFELKGRAAFSVHDLELAQKAFDDALRLARELNDAALIADILSQSGYLNFSVRRLDVAETQYREALEQYCRLSDTNPDLSRRGSASQWSNLGHVAYARSDFEKSEAFHLKAIEIYTAMADEKQIAGQWGYLGHTYFAARNYEKAVEAYGRAAEYDENAGKPLMAAQRYANMGHAMYALREPEPAQEFFNTALAKYKALGNAGGEAAQLSNLGLVKGDQGEFDQAIDYFNQAKDIYERTNDRINAVTQVIRLGHVRRGQNNLKAAKAHYEEALDRYHDLEYALGEGDCAMELGQVNVALKSFGEAAENYNRAKAIFADLGHKEKEAMCLVLLGQVRKAQDDTDTALAIFQRAGDLFEQMENRLGRANVFFQIGLLHFDQKQYDLAEQQYREALNIFREKEDREGEANLLANLGTLHFQTQDLAQARDEFESALDLLRKMQHPVGLAGVLVNMSFVCEAQQDYSKTHDCLREALNLFHEMKLSREAENIEKRLSALEKKADLSLTRMREELLSGPRVRTQKVEKIKRNAPCPCGSGKKAKKCCFP